MPSEPVKPVRLQRSRRKGSKLVSPNGLPVKCVTRPGIWGNAFKSEIFGLDMCLLLHRHSIEGVWMPHQYASLSPELLKLAYEIRNDWSAKFRRIFGSGPPISVLNRELGGTNLACSCGLEKRCHADTLLDLANK